MDVLFAYLPLLLVILGIGLLAGFLAGLLGIGGGVVLVPGLFYSLTALGYDPDVIMHMAIGTSLAVIVPTGFSSARAHWLKGAVSRNLVLNIGIGVLIGVCAGTFTAQYMSGEALRAFFAFVLLGLAIIMLSNPTRYSIVDDMPGQPVPAMGGVVIGGLSTLMGIGGATISVPFMSLFKVPIHKAIGTASALGMVISIPGTLGFMLIGTDSEGLPPLSIGYVNMIAWGLIVPVSVLVAPWGAHVAHKVPVNRLRTFFALFMSFVSLRMIYGVFFVS